MALKALKVMAALASVMLGATPVFSFEQASQQSFESLYLSAQRLVQVDGHRHLNLICSGSGSPVILLDAGFGDDSLTWRRLQPLLSSHTTVCSYDRAGERFSDNGPFPRDISAMTSDLHELVKAAGIATPFILVGHSMGGMNALLYADRYRGDLSGLVLLDPGAMDTKAQFVALLHNAGSVRSFWKHLSDCEAAARRRDRSQVDQCAKHSNLINPEFSDTLNETQMKIAADPTHWATLLSEDKSLESTGGATPNDNELRAAQRSLDDLPLVVVMRSEPLDPSLSPDLNDQLWAIVHRADENLAKLSSRGKLVVMGNSSHWVHLDQPQATAALVLDVLAAARGSESPHQR
jgi:pimeloyl-ACP methyl ester carboxylesterase